VYAILGRLIDAPFYPMIFLHLHVFNA